MSQLTLFDGSQKFVIDKPIRLIECFGGYGSQALALKYLGVKFEHWKLCEWAVKSIQAYKDIHFAEDNTNYSKDHSDEFILNRLFKWGISANYNEPMTKEQIKRLGIAKQRQIYNNIKATHNLVNISQVKGEDLQIEDTDKYCYIMTYSFPCQDLSKAGKGAGMEKNSGTRSGLLWEVERILDECNSLNQLPQVLLMENVPEVIGSKNIKHFAKWLEKLESLGYHCYWKILNAKDFGIPQNRERCFMVSILGDYYYEFPEPIKLEHRLKDLLEENVDEKYYLSDKALLGSINTKFNTSKLENKLPKNGICPTIRARDYKDPKCVAEPKLKELTQNLPQAYRVYDPNGLSVSLVANGGGVGAKTGLYAVDEIKPINPLKGKTKYGWHFEQEIFDSNGLLRTLKAGGGSGNIPKIIETQNLKTQLCNELIASGKVKENDVIRHSYSKSRMDNMYIQNNQFHDCSPTLDTRYDCLGVVVKSNNKRLKSLVNKMDLSQDNQFMDIYNQQTSENAGTITTRVDASNSTAVYTNYRIRKLTPKECGRLQGLKDIDIDKIQKFQSNASCYHLYGDSIVSSILCAIFGQMLNINWNEKINNFKGWWKNDK